MLAAPVRMVLALLVALACLATAPGESAAQSADPSALPL
jgi:hypothetical protein